jgi:hypothetical protein
MWVVLSLSFVVIVVVIDVEEGLPSYVVSPSQYGFGGTRVVQFIRLALLWHICAAACSARSEYRMIA